MSYSFDEAVKERIREATDIVELASQYVPLRRSGRNYVGRCPWHDDARPSLQINPVRQTFKCWVCDVGGDVFSFIMKAENVAFKEALEILANKAGVALPKTTDKKIFLSNTGQADHETYGRTETEIGHNPPPQKEVSKQALYSAAEWLAKTYHLALQTLDEAESARRYLQERGIREPEIEAFQMGYAPMQNDWLAGKAKNVPERLQILEIVGNLVKRDNEHDHSGGARYYDRFRGRLLFPIRDTQNRTIAFGGRVIPGSSLTSPAKYVNSPETPLFSKHRMLYGLDLARHRMKESRQVLIMEGYTDCIVAHQFGFRDAVAVLGTALGPEHIRILKRHVDKMILVLDGDEAGRKRADQVLELFIAQGVAMSVLTLPSGMDPADFLREYGAEAFDMLLKTEAVDALEHAFRSTTRNIDLGNDIIGASKALDTILGIIAQAPSQGISQDDPNRIRMEKTIQSLSQRFLVTELQIRQRLKEQKRRLSTKRLEHTGPEVKEGGNELWNSPEHLPDRLERDMLELWLADPTAIYEFWETVPVERCRSPITRIIYETCNRLIDHGKPATFDRLMTAMDDPKMKSLLVELDESGREKRGASTEPVATLHDELSELGESIRSEIEEDKSLSPELRKQLVREILDGFNRRDETRNRLNDVNEIRNDSATEKERTEKLLRLQEEVRKRQADKKKKLGIDKPGQ